MKMYDILDGLASDQDTVSSVFFGAVGDGPDLHCIFLEHNSREGFSNYAKRNGGVLLYLCHISYNAQHGEARALHLTHPKGAVGSVQRQGTNSRS